jgi:hypothetical protein
MASHADHFHGAFLTALILNLLNGSQDMRERVLNRLIRSNESSVHSCMWGLPGSVRQHDRAERDVHDSFQL